MTTSLPNQGPLLDPISDRKILTQSQVVTRDKYIPKTRIEEEFGTSAIFKVGLFHPESVFHVTWDLVSLMLILYQAAMIPFNICFSVDLKGVLAYVEFGISLFFILDICNLQAVVNLNTGFYRFGALIMNRRKIGSNYLRTWFFLDMISAFPYSWIADGLFVEEDPNSNESSHIYMAPSLLRLLKLFRFMRLLKLVRLAKVSRMLIQIEDYISSYALSSFFHFGKLLFAILYMAHWTACLWYYIGKSDSYTHENTWIMMNRKPYIKSLGEIYVECLYWAVTTMSTVGYGDIVPVTFTEKVFCCFVMILACGVFAFILASVSNLVESHTKEANLYRSQVSQMNYFLKTKNVPKELQARAIRYLEYRWSLRKKRHDNDLEFLSMLSEPLRDEINLHVLGKILYNYKLFRHFETGFIASLTKIINVEIFAPRDIIFCQGETGEKMYFVKTGAVDLFDFISDTTFNVVRVSGVFGEVGFLLDSLRCLSARTSEYSEVLSLDKAGFESDIERFPAVCHSLRGILKSCSQGNLTSIGVRCFCCKMRGHLAVNCPELQLGVKGESKHYIGHRMKWLKSRLPKPKLLNPYSYSNDFQGKKPVTDKIKLRYSFRNVLGVSKENTLKYKSADLLNAKIKDFQNYVPPSPANSLQNKDAAEIRHITHNHSTDDPHIVSSETSQDGERDSIETPISRQRSRLSSDYHDSHMRRSFS